MALDTHTAGSVLLVPVFIQQQADLRVGQVLKDV